MENMANKMIKGRLKRDFIESLLFHLGRIQMEKPIIYRQIMPIK